MSNNICTAIAMSQSCLEESTTLTHFHFRELYFYVIFRASAICKANYNRKKNTDPTPSVKTIYTLGIILRKQNRAE